MDTKVCYKCQAVKEIKLENFYKNKSGFANICRPCADKYKQSKRKVRKITNLENETKRCSKCKVWKSFSDYMKGGDTAVGLMSSCRDCFKSKQAFIPSKNAEENRDQFLRKTYGEAFDYDKMLKDQDGRCKLCGSDDPGWKYKYFQVDHNHSCCPYKKSCGKCVRGLLCQKCNTGLGQFQDSIELMEKAIQYLKESSGNSIPEVLQN